MFPMNVAKNNNSNIILALVIRFIIYLFLKYFKIVHNTKITIEALAITSEYNRVSKQLALYKTVLVSPSSFNILFLSFPIRYTTFPCETV